MESEEWRVESGEWRVGAHIVRPPGFEPHLFRGGPWFAHPVGAGIPDGPFFPGLHSVRCFRRDGGLAAVRQDHSREGRRLGAMVLVGVQALSIGTERQRAARGAVSCPLPAPVGDTQPLDGAPVKIQGVRGSAA